MLARDSRFKDGDVDEASVIVSKDGYVELTPVQSPPDFRLDGFYRSYGFRNGFGRKRQGSPDSSVRFRISW